VTIALGLAVRHAGIPLGGAARDVAGDALWATMMTWWIGALAPGAPIARRGAAALAVCWAVELGQLLHGPALDAARRTTIGHLVLGSDFDARDLAAYAAGVLAAAALEWVIRPRGGRAVAR
jgi:hypothetical protein